MSHFIYADHAATTAVTDTALKAMLPHFTGDYGNPSSLYRFAQEGKTRPGAGPGPGGRLPQRQAGGDLLHLRRYGGRQLGACGAWPSSMALKGRKGRPHHHHAPLSTTPSSTPPRLWRNRAMR